ncbi:MULTISPECIES: hypothetical protein [unclassified Tenacibaculum]|uniref:hypothetical protein n=1 Tax=unclassified Tenacibaculum TaxID=2635139 RepID=UPI001F2200EF|nr:MULTISPECIES: hypothetical protein [unclassified Tenacibaculum]MCF2875391.1 hypothetical protein [Tenacibaculum sp. Cn5-1]MCF2935467.1 hypothetical protein [Tenacibaculum sp. Cn5-34]MCG7512027.1 hypothetical protein [Tenacibaculum sp. Cn5-46]
MEKTQLILAVLSSSVLSAALTAFINYKINESNYKKDYYKKLINKRIDAYEDFYELVNFMSDLVYVEKGTIIHGFMFNEHLYGLFKSKLIKVMNKSLWLDDVTSSKLTELNAFLYNEVDGHIDDLLSDEIKNKKYVNFGVKHFDKFQDIKGTFRFFLNNELKNLYKLEDFFKDNRSGDKSYPIYEKEINF